MKMAMITRMASSRGSDADINGNDNKSEDKNKDKDGNYYNKIAETPQQKWQKQNFKKKKCNNQPAVAMQCIGIWTCGSSVTATRKEKSRTT